jgi:hypothetical protein
MKAALLYMSVYRPTSPPFKANNLRKTIIPPATPASNVRNGPHGREWNLIVPKMVPAEAFSGVNHPYLTIAPNNLMPQYPHKPMYC